MLLLFFWVICLTFAPIREFIVYIHFYRPIFISFHFNSLQRSTLNLSIKWLCAVRSRFQTVLKKEEKQHFIVSIQIIGLFFVWNALNVNCQKRFIPAIFFSPFIFLMNFAKQSKASRLKINSNQLVELTQSVWLHITKVFFSLYPGALYKYGI